MKGLSLLDVVARKMNCTYLSDLHYLSKEEKLRLRCYLNDKVQVDYAALFEWNDTLNYLTGLPAQRNKNEAKQALINALS